MGRRQTTERLFEDAVREAGFIVQPPKSIRISTPVEDKHGEREKRVTTPDFYVVDPRTSEGIHVEVTNSSGDTPHKEAQRRVVEKAGVKNYVIITGDQVKVICSLLNFEQRKQLLLQYFTYLQST